MNIFFLKKMNTQQYLHTKLYIFIKNSVRGKICVGEQKEGAKRNGRNKVHDFTEEQMKNSHGNLKKNILYHILTIKLMTARMNKRTITQMAKLPFLPLKPVLWRRSSSIGIYPALKLLLCSLLTFLLSTAFSRMDFFTGPLELG